MSPAHSGECLPSRQLIASAFQCYRMIHFSSACLQIGAAGASASGQLGNGGNAGSPTPTVVLNGYVWSQVSAGGLHSCGLTSGSLVPYCWGACMHVYFCVLSSTKRFEVASNLFVLWFPYPRRRWVKRSAWNWRHCQLHHPHCCGWWGNGQPNPSGGAV